MPKVLVLKQDAVIPFFLLVAVAIIGSAIYDKFEQGLQADAADLSQSAFVLGQ